MFFSSKKDHEPNLLVLNFFLKSSLSLWWYFPSVCFEFVWESACHCAAQVIFQRQEKLKTQNRPSHHLCFHSSFQSSLTINYFQALRAMTSKTNNFTSFLRKPSESGKNFTLAGRGIYISSVLFRLILHSLEIKVWKEQFPLCLLFVVYIKSRGLSSCL